MELKRGRGMERGRRYDDQQKCYTQNRQCNNGKKRVYCCEFPSGSRFTEILRNLGTFGF